uniref:Auxin-responsive protein SAUR22-like n=1 Tax=Nicotiana tabacum TaxID=4097 RepID=A0A1S4BM34_TOBAC|nr:PREDICTED: auxin-responsive protein SAUR22-like [Nicotiana tabacum]
MMGIGIRAMIRQAKNNVLVRSRKELAAEIIPKGHVAVYVGESHYKKHRRFVVPISYLEHPLFQELLRKAEDEYGFNHPMGGLTIPCSENTFLTITSHLNLISKCQ